MHKVPHTFSAALFAASLALPAAALAAGSLSLGHSGMKLQGSQNSTNGQTTGIASTNGSTGSTYSASSNAPQVKPLPPRAVKTLQKALNQHGASIKVNGRMDLNTIESVMKFQRKHNLTPTGFINRKTAAKLGIASRLKHEGANLA